ncbi:MAG: hypothetical protein Q9204_009475 [Flavoplaca sp. TL-2023a]
MLDDSLGGARSPSWEPTSPSLLASALVGGQTSIPTTSSHEAEVSHDTSENARSPSWSPTSPPPLTYSSTINSTSAPTTSHPSASTDEGLADTRSPSWSPSSPPPVATLQTTSEIQFPSQEAARSPSWTPSSPPPPLSTLYWRDPKINAMTMLTSSFSPDPAAYHDMPAPQNTLPASAHPLLLLNDSPAAAPPPQNPNTDPAGGRSFASPKREEEATAAEDGIWTGPSFTHTAATAEELHQIRRRMWLLRSRAIARRHVYTSP